jgi:Planctomycete cytochrome C
MGPKKNQKIILVLGVLFMATFIVQCTKENPESNASKVSRALVETPDSAIFSPFYDSNLVVKAQGGSSMNSYAYTSGVQTIIKNNCASTACHGEKVKPYLNTYAEIKSLVVPGNPEASELFKLVTTSDLTDAMPPVSYGVDLSITEKVKIYNWIRNGAKETPGLEDYRPAAIALISYGCGSANCHNQATATGAWGRKGILGPLTTQDTSTFVYIDASTGLVYRTYAQLKEPKLSQVWNAYKDSVKKFYADTVANASFRPNKTFASPWTPTGMRGPLNNYDDILMDIKYPKYTRNYGVPMYTDPNGKKYYVLGDYLYPPKDGASTMISRVDSTMIPANPTTKVLNSKHQGDMAFGDGGLNPSEIAQIKAWYFLDPNIPDVWKYGKDGSGILRYNKSGTYITK